MEGTKPKVAFSSLVPRREIGKIYIYISSSMLQALGYIRILNYCGRDLHQRVTVLYHLSPIAFFPSDNLKMAIATPKMTRFKIL